MTIKNIKSDIDKKININEDLYKENSFADKIEIYKTRCNEADLKEKIITKMDLNSLNKQFHEFFDTCNYYDEKLENIINRPILKDEGRDFTYMSIFFDKLYNFDGMSKTKFPELLRNRIIGALYLLGNTDRLPKEIIDQIDKIFTELNNSCKSLQEYIQKNNPSRNNNIKAISNLSSAFYHYKTRFTSLSNLIKPTTLNISRLEDLYNQFNVLSNNFYKDLRSLKYYTFSLYMANKIKDDIGINPTTFLNKFMIVYSLLDTLESVGVIICNILHIMKTININDYKVKLKDDIFDLIEHMMLDKDKITVNVDNAATLLELGMALKVEFAKSEIPKNEIKEESYTLRSILFRLQTNMYRSIYRSDKVSSDKTEEEEQKEKEKLDRKEQEKLNEEHRREEKEKERQENELERQREERKRQENELERKREERKREERRQQAIQEEEELERKREERRQLARQEEEKTRSTRRKK